MDSTNDIITLPDTITLTRYLSALITKDAIQQDNFEVLSRKPFINSSTFPAEIISCALNDEKIINLFCKYIAGRDHASFGHRGGIEYEIKIYNEVLNNLPLSTAKFYGSCYFPHLNETLIALEYIEGSFRLTKTHEPELSMLEAAVWIARLHNFFEDKVPDFIPVYDEGYYKLWIEKVGELTNRLQDDYPWVPSLCTYFIQNIGTLTKTQNTFIHGEFYPHNILVKNNVVYPIDWESAAVAPGQIDLASLIEGWDDLNAQNTIDAYKTARWGDIKNVPKNFNQTLLLSQLYFQFRWMAEFSEAWFERPKEFNLLYNLAKKAGCI